MTSMRKDLPEFQLELCCGLSPRSNKIRKGRSQGQSRAKLQVAFFIEIITIASWSISVVRNAKVFDNEAPTFEKWHQTYKHEMIMVGHRAKKKYAEALLAWLPIL